jgi:hypothetical protein
LSFRSEPGSRSDFGRGGKSGLHMAAGSGVHFGECWRRGDPTESATENRPPRFASAFRSKGEKAGQEPTGPGGDTGMLGKPPAEQDQVREECLRTVRRPVSLDSRVGRLDKWLPLSVHASRGREKTEFGLSAHSDFCFGVSEGNR